MCVVIGEERGGGRGHGHVRVIVRDEVIDSEVSTVLLLLLLLLLLQASSSCGVGGGRACGGGELVAVQMMFCSGKLPQ